uniref:Uncharacterized protein n=1 Tax=Anguilla anguilla TaxID=7936 RepID=A0A0E9XUP2_ANGAN
MNWGVLAGRAVSSCAHTTRSTTATTRKTQA